MKLGATDLRIKQPTPEELSKIKRNPIYIICDNILDTYNVGAIFRLADAAAVSGVYLVGDTAVPTNPLVGHKIHKASVGVWQWMKWKHVEAIHEAIADISKDVVAASYLPCRVKAGVAENKARYDRATTKLHVVAIEQSEKSIPYTKAKYDFPLVLILGHETNGISEEGLKLANQIVEIPMFGVNKSLNVMVSLAIVMWHIIHTSMDRR